MVLPSWMIDMQSSSSNSLGNNNFGLSWTQRIQCGVIRLLERRQGLKVGCPEEVAWRKNWINKKELKKLAENMLKSGYGKYLLDIQKDPFFEN